MNIFYYFKELNTPMYQWQHYHFFDELQRSGHHIISFNPLVYSSIDEANEKVIDVLKKEKDIDLFLTCDDSDIIYKETIQQIKHSGIPTCLICWDNLELPYKQKEIAPFFDIVWITSQETQYLFEQWGCKRIIFETYAANPYIFSPHWERNIPVIGFIGSPYGSRVNKLNDLLNAQIACRVYSDSLFRKGYNSSIDAVYKFNAQDAFIKAVRYMRFPIGRKVLYSTLINRLLINSQLNVSSKYLTCQNSVDNDEMIKLYSNFALSLNITELRDTYICKRPVHKIHLRTFEIPMSGGLEMASYTDELASYFNEEKEIVFYRTKEEMIDKAKFYLNPHNENIVFKMKMAARKRAEKEHTWTNRFNKVFTALG